MKQAWWLAAFLICWCCAGFALFSGREISSTDDAQAGANRIISLAPNITEILYALGIEDKIVGLTLDCDYPPEAGAKVKVGTFWQPNIEAIIALRPELVITLDFERQKDMAARLKRIGYNCLTVAIESTGDLFKAIETIGATTERLDQANILTDNMQTELDTIAAHVAGLESIKVLWVVQREPLRVAGRKTFINEIIELAGGENAIGSTLHQYPAIGAEQVIASKAQVIIEPAMEQTDLTKQHESAIRYWSRFKNLPAVAGNHIYVIDGDTVSRLSPRLGKGVQTVASCLRPGLHEN